MTNKAVSTRLQDPPPYSPLDPKRQEIRLITFISDNSAKPAPEAASDVEFSCNVHVFPLDAYTEEYTAFESQVNSQYSAAAKLQDWRSLRTESYPARFQWGDYVAMSHTWGERSQSNLISVNDQTVRVSQNLVEGLKALSKYPAVASGSLKIWNDFLCLDQQNKDEVERELKNMSTIYSTAYEVVAWIGPPHDKDALTISMLQGLDTSNMSGDALYHYVKDMSAEIWPTFVHFCEREYWRRMWVVQEMIMGGPETVLLCGNVAAPLSTLWRLVSVIVNNSSTFHSLFNPSMTGEKKYYCASTHNAFSVCSRLTYLSAIDNCLRSGTDCNILRLLDICRGSLQQYPPDKVYGVLGLLPKRVSSFIKPDLGKAAHAVYTDLTKAVIQGMERLDILENCRIDAVQTKYPTWTPDLEVKSMSHSLGTRALADAGGELENVPTFSKDGLFLRCQGLIIDKIDHLTPSLWPLVPVSPEEIGESSSLTERPPGDKSALSNALWKTLVAGSANGNHDSVSPEEFARILELNWPEISDETKILDAAANIIAEGWCSVDEEQDLVTFLKLLHRAGRDFDLCGYPLQSFFGDAPVSANLAAHSMESKRQTIKKVLRQAGNTMKRRRLAVTKDGRMSAVVRQARKDDLIAVLRGCSTPLVLRPSKSLPTPPDLNGSEHAVAYAVVGDCYVHGIMKGEAMTNKVEIVDIVLC